MPTSTNHDNIYTTPKDEVAPFRFDENVVQVFPDMINRSVPGYELTLPLIGLIAARYAQPHSNIYDLGSSLGAVTLEMRHRITRPGCRIVAVDNSAAMIARCQEILDQDDGPIPVDLVESNIQDCPIERASVVILNFTLQFIAPADRKRLLQKIYANMLPGAALVLSEKVVFSDAAQNERFIKIHHDFKRANGYSDLEVSQKRTALENVLIPDTISEHQHRLQAAGFANADVWFQAFNFMSILSLKSA
ncbi:MAG: carboxy-S-adenosyl-L-methionine synthase CmoA [Chloroflexi bacterium]|nr:MAG: carboxy-S-adenosyl-L-methionine synthase CmoA [Chloroflexota bacterium]